MKIGHWIKPFESLHYHWKNTLTNDEIGIERFEGNLYYAYVKIYHQFFKKIRISKRPQTLKNVEVDAINYMKRNP